MSQLYVSKSFSGSLDAPALTYRASNTAPPSLASPPLIEIHPMPAPRVVSLLPSATETLCAIGGRHLLVGRSHECDYPPGLDSLPILTAAKIPPGTPAEIDAAVRAALTKNSTASPQTDNSLYTLDEPLLAKLRPDVILTQDLCQVCSIDLRTVERIAASISPRPAVVSLNPHSFEGVLDDLLTVGRAVGLEQGARHALVALRERFFRASDYVPHFAGETAVAFLEWTDPLFVGGHWTPQLIERAGAHHPLNPTVPSPVAGAAAGPVGASMATAGKSVRVPDEVFAASRPDAIIICPCGIPLSGVRQAAAELALKPWWKDLPAVKRRRVALVDGNQYFNRPGPRLVDAFCFLVAWLHDRPEVMPPDFSWEGFDR